MEAISDFAGTNVYCEGKAIGRINDVIMDLKAKKVKALKCRSNTGIIRCTFFVREQGILHLERNGAVVDKKYITYNTKEEYSGFGIFSDNGFAAGTVGDVYIDTKTHLINSVSIKKGLIEDFVFGREMLDANSITLTDKGVIIVNSD